MFPAISTAKLIGLAIAAAAILSFVLLAFHWRDTMTARGKELSAICGATRAAADNPKMDCKQVSAQIGQLGKSIADLKAGIASQNAAVAAQGAKTVEQQKAAAEAIKGAAHRVSEAEAVSKRLRESARTTGAQAGCKASKALEEQWR